MKYEAIFFDYAGTIAYEKPLDPNLKLHVPEFIKHMIKKLHHAGYRLGVISNSSRYGDLLWLKKRMQEDGVLPYFETIVSSGAWGIHKPDAEIFMRPLNFMNIKPGNALMVGNAPKYDIDGSRQVGMDALLVDLDKEGSWESKLMHMLEDPNMRKRKPNLLNDFEIIQATVTTRARNLSHGAHVGDLLIVGGKEFFITNIDKPVEHEDVIKAGNKNILTISIREA